MKKISLLICTIALSGVLAFTAVSCRTVKDIPEDLIINCEDYLERRRYDSEYEKVNKESRIC